MPYLISFFILFTLACGQKNQNADQEQVLSNFDTAAVAPKTDQEQSLPNNFCWKGSLGGKTPVFVHYQQVGDLVVGEITYLKTKKKMPIRLIGELHNEDFYRLLEYDPKGNITGIIEGSVKNGNFSGNWIAPTTQKELAFTFQPHDSLIVSPDIKTNKNNIFGTYAYAYGEEGYSGQLEITEADNSEADFYLISLTSLNMGPNIAEIERDKMKLQGNFFTYKIPYSEDCEIRVDFYRDFARVRYTKGDCPGQFGHNATVEGIFPKIKE